MKIGAMVYQRGQDEDEGTLEMSSIGRVLIVDDDESIREFVSLALSDEGYEVICAPHGAAALSLIEETEPHVILLDMRMPIMDGWEFVRTYRRRSGPHAPIVAVTAGRDNGSAANIQADAVLAKPFDLADLFEVVGRFSPVA